MEQLEKAVVSKLLHDAWFKLKILQLNPSIDNIFDETGSYSVRQLLEQKIQYLESVDLRLLNHSNQTLLVDSNEEQFHRNSIDSFDDIDRYALLCSEDRILSRQLENLRRLHDLTHYDLVNEFSLAISKNIFVRKWEQSRMEQLTHTMDEPYRALEQSSRKKEANIQMALKANRLIDQYYSWQLEKTGENVDGWMERFQREKEDVDSRLQRGRAQKRRWDDMKQQSERWKEEIAHLEKLESEHQTRITRREAAIKIQKWWRSVMTRLGIVAKRRRKPKRKRKAKASKKEKKGK
ncbi:uncharacterized protein LOC128739674 [Sabethes cyaneus]|uniref:uncharacterized protein LOC128739674 n=1 Tax=Sabethes cyaneus TaxID=53552 RepID=UPI00237E54CD|nr:uncharacterized protein LOC128739674 [Sabethes cyaneus]